MKASKWLTAAFLLLFSSASFAQSNYPRSKGTVSDYAGKLSETQVAELSFLIKDYQRQTSIEIAVVVVDTLNACGLRLRLAEAGIAG